MKIYGFRFKNVLPHGITFDPMDCLGFYTDLEKAEAHFDRILASKKDGQKEKGRVFKLDEKITPETPKGWLFSRRSPFDGEVKEVKRVCLLKGPGERALVLFGIFEKEVVE